MLKTAAILALAGQCAPEVAPSTLASIVVTESKGNPLAIGVNSGPPLPRQPASRTEAVQLASRLIAAGGNLDLGLAQINSANLASLGLSVSEVFEPCTNLKAAAVILSENYQRAIRKGHPRPLSAALSAYNTGDFAAGFENGYVRRVFGAARLVAPVRQSTSIDEIGRLLVSTFGGRITDTVRPIDAPYGAERSFHKIGQAVDFVPDGGATAVSKSEIRRTLESRGVKLLELLGPGDPDHDDHFHIAFDNGDASPLGNVVMDQTEAAPPPPPAWDVFAFHDWQKQWGSRR